MSCGFDLGHYRELLRAANTGGYRWAFFDGEPRDGDLILRHDVDLSLDAALRMAELEAEEGAAATFFLMTESVFYNLGSPEGVAAIARLGELGHRVGLHGVWPNARLDGRFEPVVAWHNPDPEFMSAPVEPRVRPDCVQADVMAELPQPRDRRAALRRAEVVEDRLRHQEVRRGRAFLRLQFGHAKGGVE